jgi:hypothetical protein
MTNSASASCGGRLRFHLSEDGYDEGSLTKALAAHSTAHKPVFGISGLLSRPLTPVYLQKLRRLVSFVIKTNGDGLSQGSISKVSLYRSC